MAEGGRAVLKWLCLSAALPRACSMAPAARRLCHIQATPFPTHTKPNRYRPARRYNEALIDLRREGTMTDLEARFMQPPRLPCKDEVRGCGWWGRGPAGAT